MPRPSVTTSKALVAMIVLACAFPATAAETEKEKRAAYMGLSREQVYAKLGDPRNLMKAGPREIMFFPHLKLTLRSGVVVEVDEVLDEPLPSTVRRPAAEVPAPTAATPAPEVVEPTTAKKTVAATPAPEANAPRPAPPVAVVSEPTSGATPSLEIKSVRPPVGGGVRPVSKAPIRAPEPTPAAVSKAAAVVTPAPVRSTAAIVPMPVAPVPAASAPATVSASATLETMPISPPAGAQKTPEPAMEPSDNTAPDIKSQKLAPKRSLFRRHTAVDDDLPEPTIFTTQTYVFGAALLGAIGYLIWWRRQRSLELAATTVSSTPFEEAVPADSAAMFTSELLAKLEWKRFEELVAAYYIKTGVVAVRTNAGPESPVHLKISWKGEAKPFAGVQCHSNPPGLIRSGPLQQLADALAAADIRRGYVVTNGKFNVEARDLASEKHFTLLSGDILLEKLNALPPPARAELMQEITKGDYSTPTCPKCDVKMLRTDENSWRCTNQPRCEQVIPARKA